MNPPREIGKALIVAGMILFGAGAVLLLSARASLRLGRLPGDIAVQGRHGSFYFPIVTCIIVSLAFTLVMWLVSFFRR